MLLAKSVSYILLAEHVIEMHCADGIESTKTVSNSGLKTNRNVFQCFCIRERRFGWFLLLDGLKQPAISPKSNYRPLVVVVVVVYPTPSEGWGHGGRPWSPRSRATPQGLDQRS